MAGSQNFDIAVVGSSPLAMLLAGLLASRHGRRVCLLAAAYSPVRLPRHFDLSLAPVTRPETLRLLLDTAADAQKLIAGIGRRLSRRIDPVFVAETPATQAAIGHFRHLARAWGVSAEQILEPRLAAGPLLRLRDVALLDRAGFAAAAPDWLEGCGVRTIDPDAAQVTLRRDGGLRLAGPGGVATADRTILADDDAILRHAPGDLGDVLLRRSATAVLTGPSPVPREAFVSWLDRGLSLLQRGPAGVAAVATGDPATVHERLGASVRPSDPLPRAGETRYAMSATSDGAPFLGPLKGGKSLVIAGFGMTGMFLAPAIARFLCDASPAGEAAWFAAHGAARPAQRAAVAEYTAFAA